MDGEQDVWGWWRAPLDRSSQAVRWATVALLTLLTAVGSVVAERNNEDPFTLPDARFYLRMAQGRMTEVQQPFASRPLAPLLARGLAAALHARAETGFAVLGMACLLFLLTLVFALATEAGAPRWLAIAMASVAFWPQVWHGYPLPDLPYAALLGGLLLLLRARQFTAAALWILPLTLARESTMLVLLCLVLVGWRELRPWRCGLAFAAGAVGSVVVRQLTAGATGNQEGLPAALYLAGKVPWNLLRTLGVVPWSSLYPYLCPTPAWRLHVGLGALQEIGVCTFGTDAPVWACMALLTTFGLLPLLVVITLSGESGKMKRAWVGLELMPRFCLVYGAVSYLLAAALGTAYSRLFGYGWPLFLVTLPALLGGMQRPEQASSEAPAIRRWRGWAASILALAHALLLYLTFQFWGLAVLESEAALWALAVVAWRIHVHVTRRAVPATV